MSEPTTTSMPSAYDAAATLLGRVRDRFSLQLADAISGSSPSFDVVGSLASLELPAYLTFTTGEIIFVEGVTGNTINNVVRGARGTTAATHDAGESLWQGLTGKQISLFRDALLAAEKYQGLVGATGSKPTGVAGEVFVDTTLDYTLACVAAGVWMPMGLNDHGGLLLLTADDHSQYHNDSRALTWHNALAGGHIVGGDAHDHLSDAAGVACIVAGPADDLPATPEEAGSVYYATDDNELYLGLNGSTWLKVTGAPSGAIAMFDQASVTAYGGACPPGWSRFTALDSKFPVGGTNPASLGNVGADTHTHAYSGIASHYHSVSSMGLTTDSQGGSHSHNYLDSSGGSGWGMLRQGSSGGLSTTGFGGTSHAHSGTYPEHTTDLTKDPGGSTSGSSRTSGSATSRPPYVEVIFCEKD
jgi:hypothetical protein